MRMGKLVGNPIFKFSSESTQSKSFAPFEKQVVKLISSNSSNFEKTQDALTEQDTNFMIEETPETLIHQNNHMALPGLIRSPGNPMQRLRNILAELELEEDLKCETSKNAQPTDWEVAQTELLLDRTVQNTKKMELLT